MAVAAVMANLRASLPCWREVDWRACAACSDSRYSGCSARRAWDAARVAVDAGLSLDSGLFLIAMVPALGNCCSPGTQLKLSLWHLAVGGAVIGYITGIGVFTAALEARRCSCFISLHQAGLLSDSKPQVHSRSMSANP